jgi:hypothetical protein
VITLDHDVQTKCESNLKKYRQIEKFAQSYDTVSILQAEVLATRSWLRRAMHSLAW